MQWAVLGLVIFGLILTYVIGQEMRAHTYWRGLVAKGDVNAVRLLLQQELDRWRTMRVPRGTPAALWHGVQTVELVAVGATAAQVTCAAEGEYRFTGGKPQEISSPLDSGMRVSAKLIDMLLFDVPNLRLSTVRVDVYTTFHDPAGVPEQRCILSTVADRAIADEIDWEALTPSEIIGRFDSCYRVDSRGLAEPIDPGPPLEGTELVTELPSEPTGSFDGEE